MKLFVVVFGCLMMVAFLTWMTISLQKIQMHRDNMKHVQELNQEHNH